MCKCDFFSKVTILILKYPQYITRKDIGTKAWLMTKCSIFSCDWSKISATHIWVQKKVEGSFKNDFNPLFVHVVYTDNLGKGGRES